MSCTSSAFRGFSGDFPAAFAKLFPESKCEELFARKGPRRGGTPKLGAWQWLMARVYHSMAETGSFSTQVKRILGLDISDSALSQRSRSIGHELVLEVFQEAVGPMAGREAHPEAFHKGKRLVALDGTVFNLRNTEAMEREAVKIPDKNGNPPAFAHLRAVVLLELGMRQPLAVELDWTERGEATLTRRLAAKPGVFPQDCLVLGDRLFGSPWLVWELGKLGVDYLLRVKSNIKTEEIERLADGSLLVRVPVSDPKTRRKLGEVVLREIRALIHFEGEPKPMELRLWTSLPDAAEHPARELAGLYNERWGEEVFFRELKSQLLHSDNLLDSQTPQSAAQEVVAMLLAASIIASQRSAVAQRAGVRPARVSFAQVHEQTAALCRFVELAGELLSPEGRIELVRRLLDELAQTAIIRKRKPRSCKRAVRQPAKPWPKMREPVSKPLVKSISIPNP